MSYYTSPSLSDLTSLRVTIARSIHVAANGMISFLLMAEQYSIVHMYMYPIFFMHSSVDGHLHCFHLLTIVNSASVNIRVHIPFRSCVLRRTYFKLGDQEGFSEEVTFKLRLKDMEKPSSKDLEEDDSRKQDHKVVLGRGGRLVRLEYRERAGGGL